MGKHTVFVYGTLRKNEKNDHLLEQAERMAEQAWTYGKLYDTGHDYPAVVEDDEGCVYGNLYEVNGEQLKQLDVLEGYHGFADENNLFNRIVQTVHTDQEATEAYVYVTAESQFDTWHWISSGDWKVHLHAGTQELLYFAYGSCMDHERFRQAGVDHLFQDLAGRGVLPGYSFRFTIKHSDGGRADIVEDGGVVEGKVYRINQEAREYLYGREGVHTGAYRPTFVNLELNGEKVTNVLTFTVIEKEQEETAPPAHYAAEILRGGEGTLSVRYLKNLCYRLETDLRSS